jgi:adenylate kinase family enzyme
MPPKKFVVIGTSGSGKSTTAAMIAEILNLPLLSADNISWLPHWVEKDHALVVREVDAATSGESWVLDGAYAYFRPLVFAKADAIVWMDTSYLRCIARVLLRTIQRWLRGELLWDAKNRERFSTLWRKDGLLWWVLSTWHPRRRDFESRFSEDLAREGKWTRIQKRRELKAFLEGLRKPRQQKPQAT